MSISPSLGIRDIGNSIDTDSRSSLIGHIHRPDLLLSMQLPPTGTSPPDSVSHKMDWILSRCPIKLNPSHYKDYNFK